MRHIHQVWQEARLNGIEHPRQLHVFWHDQPLEPPYDNLVKVYESCMFESDRNDMGKLVKECTHIGIVTVTTSMFDQMRQHAQVSDKLVTGVLTRYK